MLTVKIVPNETGNPPGKLADAELHFGDGDSHTHADGVTVCDQCALDGLDLIGFAIWERRGGQGRVVTFTALTYSVGGERRSFAPLRSVEGLTASDRIRDLILAAYVTWEDSQKRTAS